MYFCFCQTELIYNHIFHQSLFVLNNFISHVLLRQRLLVFYVRPALATIIWIAVFIRLFTGFQTLVLFRYWLSLTVYRRFTSKLSVVTHGLSPLFRGWLLLSLPLRYKIFGTGNGIRTRKPKQGFLRTMRLPVSPYPHIFIL